MSITGSLSTVSTFGALYLRVVAEATSTGKESETRPLINPLVQVCFGSYQVCR